MVARKNSLPNQTNLGYKSGVIVVLDKMQMYKMMTQKCLAVDSH